VVVKRPRRRSSKAKAGTSRANKKGCKAAAFATPFWCCLSRVFPTLPAESPTSTTVLPCATADFCHHKSGRQIQNKKEETKTHSPAQKRKYDADQWRLRLMSRRGLMVANPRISSHTPYPCRLRREIDIFTAATLLVQRKVADLGLKTYGGLCLNR
jgi:hypothetical protein